MPDAWSVDATNAAGLAAIARHAAVGGLAGAWEARAPACAAAALLGAVLGPLLGALLIVALEPDAVAVDGAALLVVIGAAGGAGSAWLSRALAAPQPDEGVRRLAGPREHLPLTRRLRPARRCCDTTVKALPS